MQPGPGDWACGCDNSYGMEWSILYVEWRDALLSWRAIIPTLELFTQ